MRTSSIRPLNRPLLLSLYCRPIVTVVFVKERTVVFVPYDTPSINSSNVPELAIYVPA